jgi:hypothetical protein
MGCICAHNEYTNPAFDKNLSRELSITGGSLHQHSRMRSITICDTIITVDINSFRGSKAFSILKEELESKETELEEFIKGLYREYNNIRTMPKSYIAVLEGLKKGVKQYNKGGKVKPYLETESKYKIILSEDTVALFNEAIQFLSQQDVMIPFEKDELLIVSAKKGLERINMEKEKRIENLRATLNRYSYGEEKDINRIIGYGDYNPVIVLALQLIDSSDNYNSRRAIFGDYRSIGIYAGYHKKLKLVSITDLSN